MVMLAEDYDYVIGGDPDRDTIDLAVVTTATGGVRAHLADDADASGYERTLARADRHAPGRHPEPGVEEILAQFARTGLRWED